MCLAGVVVKNTFLEVLEDGQEALSPRSSRASRGYRKARSDEVLSASSAATAAAFGGCAAFGATLSGGGGRGGGGGGGGAEDEDLGIVAWARALRQRPRAAGATDAAAPVAEVAAHAEALAFDPQGCHIVQRAIEAAAPGDARDLARRLRGRVLDAARSPYAHFVLEKIVHHLGSADAAFVAQEMRGNARAIALNIYGCGVVCRLLEFSATAPWVVTVMDEILAQDPAALCCHKFGHRVAMSLVANGSEEQRRRVVAALRGGGLQRYARHRFAARVLEHALAQGSRAEVKLLASQLMEPAGTVVSLACHSFGVQVVRGLLELPEESKVVVQYLQKACRKLRRDKFGANLAHELGLDEDPPEERSAAATVSRAYAALGA